MNQEPTPASELAGVPDEWPGAFGVYKYSRAAVVVNLWRTLLPLGVIYFAFSMAVQFSHRDWLSPIALLVEPVILVPSFTALLAGIDRKKVSFSQSLEALTVSSYLRFLGIYLLLIIIAIISLIALIVPFFIIMPRLLLAPWYVVDQGMSPMEALSASWDHTKDHVSAVYGVVGASLLFGIIALTIIGIPFAIYFGVCYAAAFPVLYKFLQKQR